ncbi:MAG: hypothetical protein WD355_03135 [Balneolaceae bacterium]
MKQKIIWIGSLFVLSVACSNLSEEATTVDATQQEALASEFEQSVLPQYLEQIHADSSAMEQLPLEERRTIAEKHGISREEEQSMRSELKLFIEDLGLDPSEFELLETPYFFVDGRGEVMDLDAYKGLFSYVKNQRELAESFNESVNALYEEYEPRIEKAIAEEDSVELQRLVKEFEEKRLALVE